MSSSSIWLQEMLEDAHAIGKLCYIMWDSDLQQCKHVQPQHKQLMLLKLFNFRCVAVTSWCQRNHILLFKVYAVPNVEHSWQQCNWPSHASAWPHVRIVFTARDQRRHNHRYCRAGVPQAVLVATRTVIDSSAATRYHSTYLKMIPAGCICDWVWCLRRLVNCICS